MRTHMTIAILALIVVLTGCTDLPAGAQQQPRQQQPKMLQPEVERRAVLSYPEPGEVAPVAVRPAEPYPVPDDDDCYTQSFAGNADARDPRPHEWSTDEPVQTWISKGTMTVLLTGDMTTDPRSDKESLAMSYLGRSPEATRLQPGVYTLEAWGDSALFICPMGTVEEEDTIVEPGKPVRFLKYEQSQRSQVAAPQTQRATAQARAESTADMLSGLPEDCYPVHRAHKEPVSFANSFDRLTVMYVRDGSAHVEVIEDHQLLDPIVVPDISDFPNGLTIEPGQLVMITIDDGAQAVYCMELFPE